MARTTITFSRNLGEAKEAKFRTLTQLSTGDTDYTTAVAATNRSTWVYILNSDGSLRHVELSSDIVTPT